MAKKKPSLQLSLVGGDLSIEVLNPKRITHHGFGSFLEKYVPTEIQITQEAKAALLAGQPRSGVQGMEFFNADTLAWGSKCSNFFVPLGCVNVEKGAVASIKKFAEV